MRLQLVMAHIEIAAEAMCPSAGDHHARTAKPVETCRPPALVLWEGQLRLVHGIDDDAEHATCSQARKPSHVPIDQSIMILARQVFTPLLSTVALRLRSATAFVQER